MDDLDFYSRAFPLKTRKINGDCCRTSNAVFKINSYNHFDIFLEKSIFALQNKISYISNEIQRLSRKDERQAA